LRIVRVPVPISMWDTPAVSLSPASLCLPSAKFHADDISNMEVGSDSQAEADEGQEGGDWMDDED
jgi:hypothetical protein